MPVRPIDLQTLFVRLDQIGREQNAGKDGLALQQSIQGAIAQKKEVESKEAVRLPSNDGAESRAVGQAPERRHPGQPSSQEPEGEADRDPAKSRDEVLRDPDLGNRLDVSG